MLYTNHEDGQESIYIDPNWLQERIQIRASERGPLIFGVHATNDINLLAGPHELFVPVLWPYEVGNILGRAARKGRISSDKAHQFMEDLDSFHITIDDGTSYALNRVYDLACKHQLTTYDAAYLELAIRKDLPLASLDDHLNKAALSEGVILIESKRR